MTEPSTRGTRALEDLGITFEIVPYVYKRKGASRAADAVGWPEEQVIKSLVVRIVDGDLRFALVPTHRDLSPKKLARVWGVKSVELAQVRDAERVTGYVEGGISPFGSYEPLPTIMDESLFDYPLVLINAGRRGVLVGVDPWDIQGSLEAEVDDIVA